MNKTVIKSAMDHIENHTCVRFIEQSDDYNHYIYIENSGDICDSEIGYGQRSRQVLSLSPKCLNFGTAVHELMHVLGFFHQHSVHNRDNFIRIIEKNLKRKALDAFKYKANASEVTDFGFKYDYESITHYGPYTASRNGKQTIIPLQNRAGNMGQRNHLSITDIYKINRMYNCDGWEKGEI